MTAGKVRCRLWLLLSLLGSLLLLQPSMAVAALSDDEFQVNHTPLGRSFYADGPAMAMDANDNYVVVWLNDRDSGYSTIYAQRFTAAAQPIGAEFAVSPINRADESAPAVAMASNGNFVVVWSRREGDSGFFDIYGRRFDNNGNSLGEEFRVNSYTTDQQVDPAVAYIGTNSFVITWSSAGQDGNGDGIFAQRFAATGEPLGREFLVNRMTGGNQFAPTLAGHTDDSFLVVWQHSISEYNVHLQFLDVNGSWLGDELAINTGSTNLASGVGVAIDRSGNALVIWQGLRGGEPGIYGQRYSPARQPVGTVFPLVTTGPDNLTSYPRLTATRSSGFLLTWQQQRLDGSGLGIFARRLLADGSAYGNSFQVNLHTTNDQGLPAVAARSLNHFTVAWLSVGQGNGFANIWARAYAPPLNPVVTSTDDPGDGFCDRFGCTLREAMTAVNLTSQPQTISFAIPGPGPHTIQLTSMLPTITNAVVIDGYTQPGAQPNTNPFPQPLNTVLQVEVRGGGFSFNWPSTVIRGLAINGGIGIQVIGRGTAVQGNFIGTDVTGTVAKGGNGVWVGFIGNATVGGSNPAERNLLAGLGTAVDATYGIGSVSGNYIGTDISGSRALGNGTAIVAGSFPQGEIRRIGVNQNLISGNGGAISLGDGFGSVTNNLIGTDWTGTLPLPNGGNGVSMNTYGNNVSGNLIAYNPGHGIAVSSGSFIQSGSGIRNNTIIHNGKAGVMVASGYVAITQNQIRANGGLGIDLGNDGVTPNDFRDTDGGPNVLQNYPILQLVTNGGDGTTLQGFFQGRSNQTVTLEFFENQACDPAGYGEGETFLERQIITTDATGRAYLTFNRPTQLPWGHGLTATATADYAYSTTGSHPTTSEFSACRVATTLVNSALTAAIANVRYRNELVDYAPAGVYTIVALFTNHTTLPIANLAFKVATLSNGNYLLNADGHPGGVGAVLNLPVSLAPGAAQVVTFQIGLQAKVPFNFVVDAYGVLGNGAGAAESLAPGAGFAYAITAGDLAPTNGGQTQLYLPWIER